MNTITQRLTTNWHLIRIFRLGIGIMFIIMGFQSQDWMIGLFSTFFLYQAITDTGCCGSGSCTPRYERTPLTSLTSDQVVEFEEIK